MNPKFWAKAAAPAKARRLPEPSSLEDPPGRAAVLGMLESWLGEAASRDGIRAYLKAHEYGSATSADLFSALSKSSSKDVWPIASTFLDQPGVPLVRGELVCEKGAQARLKLSQSRYRARAAGGDAKGAVWKIPICVAFEGGKAPACGLLAGPDGEIPLTLPPDQCWAYRDEGATSVE